MAAGSADCPSVFCQAGSAIGCAAGTGLRIVQKRVDLINCDCAFEAIAVPI